VACRKDMITVIVDDEIGQANVHLSEAFHKQTSTFKVDVLRDVIEALTPLHDTYWEE
jgi:C4-type Zn-finger protein